LLAKGPVHSAHLLCPIDSLREQARSHGFVVSHRFENTHRTCGSNRGGAPPCLRRGRYIQHICFARYTAFASKLASTDLRIFTEPAGQPRNLWEQACLRRGRYIQHICFARYTAFASKLAPTEGEDIHRTCGPAQNLWGQPGWRSTLLAKAMVKFPDMYWMHWPLREQARSHRG